jgi:putative membrane protein
VEPGAFLLGFAVATGLGFAAGAATGLAPGLHVNNVAALVLATQGAWTSWFLGLHPSAGPEDAGILVVAFLVSAAMSHAVFEFVPSVFLGAPSEGTALSVLPGHRMLGEGRGVLAVALAARGALLGLLVAVALLVPLRFVLADPVRLHEAFRPWTVPFVLGILGALLVSEATRSRPLRRIGSALFVQGLAGLLGTGVLRGPSGIGPDAVLFPLFSGLFGLPGLLVAARGRPARIPPQDTAPAIPRRGSMAPVLRGALAGAAVSWLPGLSAGTAAALASLGRRPRAGSDPATFMVVLGAVATSTTFLSIAVLSVIGRARSGVAAAARSIAGDLPWQGAAPPAALLVLLGSAALAAATAAPCATRVARVLARRLPAADPRRLARATLACLAFVIGAVTGPPGLLVAGLAALVGTVPVRTGVRRVHLMAALLVPVALG